MIVRDTVHACSWCLWLWSFKLSLVSDVLVVSLLRVPIWFEQLFLPASCCIFFVSNIEVHRLIILQPLKSIHLPLAGYNIPFADRPVLNETILKLKSHPVGARIWHNRTKSLQNILCDIGCPKIQGLSSLSPFLGHFGSFRNIHSHSRTSSQLICYNGHGSNQFWRVKLPCCAIPHIPCDPFKVIGHLAFWTISHIYA